MLDVALLAIPKGVLIASLIDDRYKYNQGFNGFYKALPMIATTTKSSISVKPFRFIYS
jgi:hypothetical protein